MIREKVAAVEGGDVDAFWQLQRLLMAHKGGQVFAESFVTDLTSSPGWVRADAVTRRAIVNAAETYLRRADPEGGSAVRRSGAKPSPAAVEAASVDRETRDDAEAAVGELLLGAVALARRLGVDPELALRAAADRLRDQSR